MVVYSNAPWARFTERRSHGGTTVSRTDPPRQLKRPNRPWHLHRKTLKPQTPNNSVPHPNESINCRRTSDTTWDLTLTTALVTGSTRRDIGAQVLQQGAVMAHGRHEDPQSQLRSWQQLEQLLPTRCTPHKCRGHSWAERAQVQTIYCGIAWTSESKCKIYINTVFVWEDFWWSGRPWKRSHHDSWKERQWESTGPKWNYAANVNFAI